MGEFTIRADSVDVEQIMRQIRARIREKRGVDYTEQQIRELATVKLERFLDAGSVRSDLLQHFRQGPAPDLPNYSFEDATLFESHRAPVRWARRLLRPLLKLFFNPNPLIQALHIQSKVNSELARSFQQHAELSYEVLHNLVVELTRLGVEVRNLKMRAESLSSRLDFDERRARALETVVQYKPAGRASGQQAAAARTAAQQPAEGRTPTTQPAEGRGTPRGEGGEPADAAGADSAEARSARRRRRRRGRRNAPQGAGTREESERNATNHSSEPPGATGGAGAPERSGGGVSEGPGGATPAGEPSGGAPEPGNTGQ